ncbi:RNA helicase [Entamoeba marina]
MSSEDEYEAFMNAMEEESAQQVQAVQEKLAQQQNEPEPEESSTSTNMSEDNSDSEDLTQYKDELAIIKKKRLELLDVNHKSISYQPINKSLYVEVPDISKITATEVSNIRRNELDGCIVKGKRCPKPISTWSQCGLHSVVHEIIRVMKFVTPTPVQRQAIPVLMSGLDAIICAKTGSGKTLAYVLPLLRHVLAQPPIQSGDGPIAIVFAPIRELAEQINVEIKKFTKFLNLKSVAVFGGLGISDQIGALKRGAEIVVCTPGRMIDLLCANNGKLTNLRRVSFVVLDEADRMFDMGFGPQISRILSAIRPDRQTVMFSATFPISVEQHAREFLKAPIEVICGGRAHVSDTIEQRVEVLNEESKLTRLTEIVTNQFSHGGRILIFVETQKNADSLYQLLSSNDLPCLLLHGGIDQIDRQNTIGEFKSGVGKTILIATSLCARGIDVKGLDLVINYDCPNHLEDYVHRVGRTGRAGQKGVAVTFITPTEDKYSEDIIKALTLSGGEVSEELSSLNEQWKTKKLFLETKKSRSGYIGKGYKYDANESVKALEKKVGAYMEEDVGGMTIAEKIESTRAREKAVECEIPPDRQESVRRALETIAKLNRRTARFSQDSFQTEIIINDYSQQARQVLTNKERLSVVTESCGVAIITKGVYVPPGKPVPPGESKLHLLIEAQTESAIQQAKREIKIILKEVTEKYKDKVLREKQFSQII